jgi:hypothetical protein
MKKHGPPPWGMYKVGSLLVAFTIAMFQPGEPSRAGSERQCAMRRALSPQTLAFTLLPTTLSAPTPLVLRSLIRLLKIF